MTEPCPQCGGEMTVRTNRTTGDQFYGCKSYPNCRGTRPVDSMVTVTPAFLKMVLNMGAIKRAQAELLGEPWPLATGWRNRVMGRKISHDVANRLKSLRRTPQPKTRPSGLTFGETSDIASWRAAMIAADTSTVAPW